LRLATAWAAGKHDILRKIGKENNGRAEQGQITKIIALAKKKLYDDVKISQSPCKRGQNV
jgi:hypothetical protein